MNDGISLNQWMRWILRNYEEALYETWEKLWANKIFPNIVNQYLEKWRDRFYLFDEKYPFFQVTKERDCWR